MKKEITYHVENWCGNTILTTADINAAKKAAEEYAYRSGSDVTICAYENNDTEGEYTYYWETSLSFCEA